VLNGSFHINYFTQNSPVTGFSGMRPVNFQPDFCQ
jgi:hypothetical protein